MWKFAVIALLCLCGAAYAAQGLVGGKAVLLPYQGIAATRSAVPVTIDTVNKQVMLRTTHVSRSAMTSVAILASNFYVDSTGTLAEIGSGATASVTASVEYPAGVCTQIKFSGIASGSIPNAGTLASDAATVSIPSGDTFWIRQYWTSTGGVVKVNGNKITGDNVRLGVSGIVDQTVSCGTITDAGSGLALPMAIIAPTSSPTLCLLGDSITAGTGDTGSAAGDLGMVARAVGPTFGYTNLGVPSDRTTLYNASHSGRAAALSYCSHAIVGYGSNDLAAGLSAASLQTALSTLYSSVPGSVRIFQNTVLPRPSTSDGCTTLGGQTLPGYESARVTFNNNLKSHSFEPNQGAFDTSGATETGTNSGFWKTSPSAWSADCIHPNAFGAASIASSGAINTGSIVWP